MKVVAGMDVGKASLDGSVSAGPGRRFENPPRAVRFPDAAPAAKATDREGLQDLLRRRKPLGQQRVQESVCGQGVVVDGVGRVQALSLPI